MVTNVTINNMKSFVKKKNMKSLQKKNMKYLLPIEKWVKLDNKPLRILLYKKNYDEMMVPQSNLR